MEAKTAYIQDMFSSIAHRYDLLNTLLSLNRDKYWRRFAASKASLKRGGTVLDLATGTGRLASELAEGVGEEGRVVGIDFCERMLIKAKNKRIELALADAASLPFADNTFDCAAIGFGLRNLANVEKTLQEISRVVKAGGEVVCLEFSLPHNRLFRKIHRFFLYNVLPPIGGLISRRRAAYEYLPRSISDFSNPEKLKQLLEEAGLEDIQIYPLTWGAVTVHVGVKGKAT